MHGFGPHLGNELGRILVGQVLIVFRNCLQYFQILFFRQQVTLILVFICADTWLDHHVSFIIHNTLQFL